jgi:hypothetical protein
MSENKPQKPEGVDVYTPDVRYSGGYVTVIGLHQPCVIVDSWGDEAQIRSIIDGTEYVVAKRDLIDAEVNITVRGE